MTMKNLTSVFLLLCLIQTCADLAAQSVCLPAPRLLTTMPMGGQAGSEFELSITGQFIEDASTLHFSTPGITATAKLDQGGVPVPNTYIVKISPDCPPGIYEASVMTRLGLSASRIFSVGTLPEITQTTTCTSIETALPIAVNSVCNATVPARMVNHYSFTAKQGQRLIVDCAAKGIDSKVNPVVIVADAQGADLVVQRRGDAIDFRVPADGTYIIKVHELTFQGGYEFFFRLHLSELGEHDFVSRPPATRKVNSFSWPPHGLSAQALSLEAEPNDEHTMAQKIALPCDISGSFATAADVDTFEFEAKKGEVWWVEVASERLGLPTDPVVIVQHVDAAGEEPKFTDLAELADIASPVNVSKNGYAYDGPPYNAGSADVLGKFEIQQDGIHHLQITDLFGGTRNDPRNVYRLIVRRAAPDFALVAWAMHMELRNGDRNALSKPLALRPGATVALDVVTVRRDGFDGDIELEIEGLPAGVTASGLKIPAGKTQGSILVTAAENAPSGVSVVKFQGRSTIDSQPVTRPCYLASMAWPVADHWSEIPSPRLLADVMVSVGTGEPAPLTIAASEAKVWEVTEGQSLSIPLKLTRRCEFSGATMSAGTLGAGFNGAPKFDLPLNADTTEAKFDLVNLKTPPGDYTVAFYGGAVAKYSHNPGAVAVVESLLASAKTEAEAIAAESARLNELLKTATAEEKATAEAALKEIPAKQQAATDIVDIVVSEPILIRVKPAENK
jgi:hypothetical protein